MFHKTLRLVMYFSLPHAYLCACVCVYVYSFFPFLFSFYDRDVDRRYFTIRNEGGASLIPNLYFVPPRRFYGTLNGKK